VPEALRALLVVIDEAKGAEREAEAPTIAEWRP
jgi:hypothetical protein